MSKRAESQNRAVSAFGRARSIGAHAAGVLAAAVAMGAPAAVAQTRDSALARGLLDLPPSEAPAAERYQTPDGRVRFVLDRTTGERFALVRFEGSNEVHVLHAVPGPRGDEFFRTDTGDLLLRVTALGSVIVYTDAARMGAPAQSEGPSEPVHPPKAPPGGLRARFEALTREAARQFGRAIEFVGPDEAKAEDSGVVADAAERAAESLASAPRTVVVRRVIIRYGSSPQAQVVNESLTITVAPQLGYAGRPSTAAIQRAFGAGGPPQQSPPRR